MTGIPEGGGAGCVDATMLRFEENETSVQWINMNKLCLYELCAGELGNLRYTITQRTGIHVFLNIRNIPYFSTVVTLCCHTSQDLSYMLSQHHPTSLWSHLGHSSRVFVCNYHKFSWNILSLTKNLGIGKRIGTSSHGVARKKPCRAISERIFVEPRRRCPWCMGLRLTRCDSSKCQKMTWAKPECWLI